MQMNARELRAIATVLTLCLLASTAWADTLVMTNGTKWEGAVSEEATRYVLTRPNGSKLYFPRKMVKEIIRSAEVPATPPKSVDTPAAGDKPAGPENTPLAPPDVKKEYPILYPIRQDGKYGYMDKTGKVVVPPRYDSAREFSEGMGVVGNFQGPPPATGPGVSPRTLHRPSLFGYVNDEGKEAIPVKYTPAADFSCGLACVEGAVIDRQGRVVFRKTLHPFSEGLSFDVQRKPAPKGTIKKWVYEGTACIDTRGVQVFWLEKDSDLGSLGQYKNGRARCSRGLDAEQIQKVKDMRLPPSVTKTLLRQTRCGYLDLRGKVIIEPQFQEAHDFSEGFAAVREPDRPIPQSSDFTPGLWGVIDLDGKWAIPPKYMALGDFHDGLIVARWKHTEKRADGGTTEYPDEWGFLDKTGRVVVRAGQVEPDRFSEGLARVGEDRDMRYIDRTGRTVIPLASRFEPAKVAEAHPFRGGLARVDMETGTGPEVRQFMVYLNQTGQVVWSEDPAVVSPGQTTKPGSYAEAGASGKPWVVQVFTNTMMPAGGISVRLYQAPAEHVAAARGQGPKPTSFSPTGKKLILQGKAAAMGICRFTGVKPPFILYVTAPGHSPRWYYVSSTARPFQVHLGGGGSMPWPGNPGVPDPRQPTPPGGMLPPVAPPHQNRPFLPSDRPAAGGSGEHGRVWRAGELVKLADPVSPTEPAITSQGVLKPVSQSELSGWPTAVRGGELGNVTHYLFHEHAAPHDKIETEKTYVFAVAGGKLQAFEGARVEVRGKMISRTIKGRTVSFLYPWSIRRWE